MDISSLHEIRYIRFKRQLLLLELLEVIKGYKPGVFLELTTKNYDYSELISNLKGFIGKTKLYMSLKKGGYISKDKNLIKEWEENNDKYINANKFIGYPKCCNLAFNKTLEKNSYLIREIYWYYIIKTHTIKEILSYSKINSYVSFYPCSFNCKETIKFSKKIKNLIEKNKKLFNPSFEKKLYLKRLSSIRRILRNISKELLKGSFTKLLINTDSTYKNLKNKGLIELFDIKKDFKKNINELFSKDKNVINQIKNNLRKKIKQLK